MVDSRKEIEKLKTKYKLLSKNGKIIKPMFFKMITLENGYEINHKNKYEYRHTPMDYLQKIIGKWTWGIKRRRQESDTRHITFKFNH